MDFSKKEGLRRLRYQLLCYHLLASNLLFCTLWYDAESGQSTLPLCQVAMNATLQMGVQGEAAKLEEEEGPCACLLG